MLTQPTKKGAIVYDGIGHGPRIALNGHIGSAAALCSTSRSVLAYEEPPVTDLDSLD